MTAVTNFTLLLQITILLAACGAKDSNSTQKPLAADATRSADTDAFDDEASDDPQITDETNPHDPAERTDIPSSEQDSCTPYRPSAPLETISNFVDLLNRLPRPVHVGCVVEALPRPLGLRGTTSKLGAQPANGPQSPRIFVASGTLLLSIVPDGPGSDAIEMGEDTSEDRSIKGDLLFPLNKPLPSEAPYIGIFDAQSNSSTCTAFCHGDAVKSKQVGAAWAFDSKKIRHSSFTDVPLNALKALIQPCIEKKSDKPLSERCRILKGLVSGDFYEFDFPASVRPQF